MNEVLTKENYKKRHDFLSFTRWSKFQKCEAAAALNYRPEPSTALLVGSYVDAYFSGELEEFLANHPEILKKDGTLKADFVKADEIIRRVESDEIFMDFLKGEKQKIFTCEIDGVKVKVKIDSYEEGKRITDLKVMKDMQPVWTGRSKENFVEAYYYDVELALMKEAVKQNTGCELPTFLATITKESPSDIAILNLDNATNEKALELFKNTLPRIKAILNGEVAPHRCETCEYCRKTKKARIIPYDLAGCDGNELRENGIESDDPKLEVKSNEE